MSEWSVAVCGKYFFFCADRRGGPLFGGGAKECSLAPVVVFQCAWLRRLCRRLMLGGRVARTPCDGLQIIKYAAEKMKKETSHLNGSRVISLGPLCCPPRASIQTIPHPSIPDIYNIIIPTTSQQLAILLHFNPTPLPYGLIAP